MANQQPGQTLGSHLIAQTVANVQVLEQLGVLTPADAAAIRERLPNQYATLPQLAGSSNSHVPALPARHVPPAASPIDNQPRARALWDYSGAEADDLQFRQGDTILIDEEVNDQWFRGRILTGNVPGLKSGLFPSNYVEKIASGPAPAYGTPGYGASNYNEKASYGYGSQPQYQPPAQQSQTIVVQEEKKKKFGKYGSTLGTAAVTGVGFGAGSAVASNIVNAIL